MSTLDTEDFIVPDFSEFTEDCYAGALAIRAFMERPMTASHRDALIEALQAGLELIDQTARAHVQALTGCHAFEETANQALASLVAKRSLDRAKDQGGQNDRRH
jgi:hypothetical protein